MSGLFLLYNLSSLWFLEPAGAAHRAMITGFTTGFDSALLFFLKEVDQLRHRRFLDTELFLAWM